MIALMCFVGLASNQKMVLAQGNKDKSRANKTSSNSIAAVPAANAATAVPTVIATNVAVTIATNVAVTNVNQGYISNQSYPGSQDLIKAKVDAIASYYKLDPKLLRAIVKQESSFNPNARSSADAMGLMQMIPSTARRFGVRNPYDADESLHGGCRYFVWLLRKYNGRLDLALAGYNAGEGAVERHGNRVPPYKETQDYVRSITSKYLIKLGVRRSNQSKANQLAKQNSQNNQLVNQANQTTQGLKYASNQYKNRYKSVKTNTKQQAQYNTNNISVKATKEKLDILESYFQKR